ncbi:MAG: hypothetical protein ACYTG3_07310 [Planctomycetota bacterium]
MRIWACLLALAAAAAAQGPQGPPDQKALQGNLDQKLAKPFVKNAAWILDFAEAKRKAKELQKPIFAYFTRSYAP